MRAQIITRATCLVVLTLLLSRTQPAGAAPYGDQGVRLNYTNFVGRTYSPTSTVLVLGADDIKRIAATNAALSVLFSIPGSSVYLPAVTK
jgi:hypothetical protein